MGNDSTGTRGEAPPATEITDEETFDRLVETEDRVLVDFYADWCGPCQLMVPTVEEFATETGTPVMRVNVEELPLVAYRYDVQSIPTFLGIADGDVVGRLEGVQEKRDLLTLLE